MAQNDALTRLNQMMNNNRSPRMEVPRGSNEYLSDFATGYNMMNTIMNDIRARNDNKRLRGVLENYLGGGEKTANDLYNQYQYGDNEATLNGMKEAVQQQAQQGGGQQPFNGFSWGQQATDTYSPVNEQVPGPNAADRIYKEVYGIDYAPLKSQQAKGFSMGAQATDTYSPVQQAPQNTGEFSIGQNLQNAQYAPSGQQIQLGQTAAPTFSNVLGLGTEGGYSPIQTGQQQQSGQTAQVA